MIENLFLSVGAMKAGTTWLYEQLKNHPRFHSTPEKEIHYFEQVSGSTNPLSFPKRKEKMVQLIAEKNQAFVANHTDRIQWYLDYGRDEIVNDAWYEKLFGSHAANPLVYCADYSNLYALLNHVGWKRVRQNCKNLKVVYTLRDPLSRIWSHYKFHLQFIGKEKSIGDSNTDQFIEMLDKDWFWQHACYDECLTRFNKHLRKEELQVLYFEDFRQKPQETMNLLCDFLQIESFQLGPSSSEPVNASINMKMPEEWKAIAITKLIPTLKELKAKGMIHESWNYEI